MEIEITEKKNNPMFKRTEVQFIIKHENQGTPNKTILQNELAEALNAKKDQIIIDTIHSSFGIQQTRGYAKVYTSRKEAETIERKHILKRNQVSSAKPKKKEEDTEAAAPKPASESEPKEEAPAAENAEEKTEEA
jgi:small subunit ribosomal protein S24e